MVVAHESHSLALKIIEDTLHSPDVAECWRQALQVDRDGLMTSVTAYLEEGRLADVTLHPPPLQFTMMREMARQQVLRQDTEGALIRLREALSLEPQESHGHLLTVRLVLEILSNRVLKASAPAAPDMEELAELEKVLLLYCGHRDAFVADRLSVCQRLTVQGCIKVGCVAARSILVVCGSLEAESAEFGIAALDLLVKLGSSVLDEVLTDDAVSIVVKMLVEVGLTNPVQRPETTTGETAGLFLVLWQLSQVTYHAKKYGASVLLLEQCTKLRDTVETRAAVALVHLRAGEVSCPLDVAEAVDDRLVALGALCALRGNDGPAAVASFTHLAERGSLSLTTAAKVAVEILRLPASPWTPQCLGIIFRKLLMETEDAGDTGCAVVVQLLEVLERTGDGVLLLLCCVDHVIEALSSLGPSSVVRASLAVVWRCALREQRRGDFPRVIGFLERCLVLLTVASPEASDWRLHCGMLLVTTRRHHAHSLNDPSESTAQLLRGADEAAEILRQCGACPGSRFRSALVEAEFELRVITCGSPATNAVLQDWSLPSDSFLRMAAVASRASSGASLVADCLRAYAHKLRIESIAGHPDVSQAASAKLAAARLEFVGIFDPGTERDEAQKEALSWCIDDFLTSTC